MKLFSADLFKAFATGFVLTAAVMGDMLMPGMWSDLLAFVA